MNKTFRIYGVVLAVALVIIAVLEATKTEILDWRRYFDINKKTPFGLYVFNQEAKKFLKNLEQTNISPYEFYKKNPNLPNHNILIINKEQVDEESSKKILEQVNKGSNALIINDYFYGYNITDTLKISYEGYLYNDVYTLHLTDKKLKDSILVDKLPSRQVFSEIKKGQEILGYAKEKNKKTGINFIKIPFGKGNFYLHSEPLILTNYHLLKPEGNKYVEQVFSYLPDNKTIWFIDNYEKKNASQSPLRFILKNDALKYAWWLFLAGLILFVLFNIRRKQRAIPVIEPPKNKSVEFVKSIGNLYLQEGNPLDMAQKKIQYFLNKIRQELMIETNILDESFIKKLHLKTGKSTEKISEAVELINKVQSQITDINKEELAKINQILDDILK